MTNWWPARLRIAAMAVVTATLTGAAVAALGASALQLYGAGAYVVVTLVALFSPAAIAALVIGGQVLAGSLLLGPNGSAPLSLLPVIAGVVATAELLALVARLDAPLERDPGDGLQRAGLAALIAAGVFGTVLLVAGLPGPTGLVAITLASGACILMAVLLVRKAPQTNGSTISANDPGKHPA